MKKEILWLALVVVAAAVKVFDIPSNWGISFPVSADTHRGVPMSSVIFWTLLLVVAIWVLIDLAQRWRAGMLR
jgi:hypothetical protein